MSTAEQTETPDTETPDEEAPITEEQVEEAEQEEADPTEQPAAEPPENVAEEHFDEREAEKGRKRIDRAVANMVKVMHEVLAGEAEYLEPCPRCADDFPGLVWKPSVKGILPATRAAVMISMGEDPDPTLNPDPRANRCQVCDGYGKVATGSRVVREAKLECEECKGKGWTGPRIATIGTPAPAPGVTTAAQNGHADESPADVDPWGRVRGEPLFGVMPGFEQ